MRIIVDAFGGDNAPLEILKGCEMAVEEYPGIEIILTGSESKIKEVAKNNNISLTNMSIVDTPDIFLMEDVPTEIIKSKRNTSMAVGMYLLADDKGEAFVSAGSSGAMMVGATMIVKRIKGIKRCTFAPVVPKDNGAFMLIDGGANIECRPHMLEQFGIMGSIYMSEVMGIKNPRVGLVNVGVEETKGSELQREAYELLKSNENVNFIGNIEAREIPKDAADVVVCDGFTGNIILKLYEGVAITLMKKIKRMLMQSTLTKVAAMLLKKPFMQLKKQFDYNEIGGAPVLGARKPVFKAHGDATATTIKNAIGLAIQYANLDVVSKIENNIQMVKEDENVQ